MSYIKILSDEDLEYLNKKYEINVKDDYLTIRTAHHNRLLFHTLDEKIRIRYGDKTMMLTPIAVKYWKDNFTNFTLIDVQNAINTLSVLAQDISIETIENLLKRRHSKIITI